MTTPPRSHPALAMILVAIISTSAFVVTSATAAAAAPSCFGKKATIVGTNRDKTQAVVLTGTAGNDVIIGLQGVDHIYGGGGDDVICAARGDDHIDGGPGNDRIRG